MEQGHKCWNCGGPGINYTGSKNICPKCEVVWFPMAQTPSELSDRIVCWGAVIDVIDFTQPNAPSSPA